MVPRDLASYQAVIGANCVIEVLLVDAASCIMHHALCMSCLLYVPEVGVSYEDVNVTYVYLQVVSSWTMSTREY